MDHKREGNKGQLEKEVVWYCRKTSSNIFKRDTPIKANCECPVGTYRLCASENSGE